VQARFFIKEENKRIIYFTRLIKNSLSPAIRTALASLFFTA
jgi:hypothetical protein